MDEQENPPEPADPPGHWSLLGDVIVFQFKLALDGLRDVLLSPLSIGATIFGMIFSPSNPGRYFSRLLEIGHQSDRWINLFGAASNYDEQTRSSDEYFRKATELLRKEYEKGGMVRDVKEVTDELLERLRNEQDRK